MKKILITKEQYNRLFETGSNSAAMDLDIYVQPLNYNTDNGNSSVEDSIEDSIDKLKELNSLFKGGKKTKSSTKNNFFKILDKVNQVYDETKTSS